VRRLASSSSARAALLRVASGVLASQPRVTPLGATYLRRRPLSISRCRGVETQPLAAASACECASLGCIDVLVRNGHDFPVTAAGVKRSQSWRPIQAAGALERWLLTARCRLLRCRRPGSRTEDCCSWPRPGWRRSPAGDSGRRPGCCAFECATCKGTKIMASASIEQELRGWLAVGLCIGTCVPWRA
jgi:hypothetical protein